MSNVLGDNKQQQVLALGRLGWSLRRIEQATTVRRETASAYLKAAGIPVRERGGRPGVWPPKPATTPEVSKIVMLTKANPFEALRDRRPAPSGGSAPSSWSSGRRPLGVDPVQDGPSLERADRQLAHEIDPGSRRI